MKIVQPASIPSLRASFSRASTATFIDSAGMLQTAEWGVMRYQGGQMLLEPAATNHFLNSQNIGASSWFRCSAVLAAETYRGFAPFWTVAKITSITSESRNQNAKAVVAGEVGTITAALLAGSVSQCSMGILLGSSSWGLQAASTAEILEGPGVISARAGSLCTVTGLSATIPTLLRITRTFDAAGTAGTQFFPGVHTSTTIGHSVKLTRVQYEVGPATSYIPTTTAPATRAADVFENYQADLFPSISVARLGLFSTNAARSAFSWADNQGAIYSIPGTRVEFEGKVYELAELAPGQTAPITDVPGISPKWLLVGPDNLYAWFDGELNTRTVAATPSGSVTSLELFLSLKQACDTIFVGDIAEAAALRVEIRQSLYGPVIFDQTYTAGHGARLRSQYLVSGFSAPADALINITIVGASVTQPAGVGIIVLGQAEAMGHTRYGARAGMRDYSRKEADDFGQVQFVRRAFSKTVSASVEVEKADINRVSDRLYELRATPLVWIFTDDAELSTPLVVFGFYRDFYSSIDFPQLSIYSLEVEGLA